MPRRHQERFALHGLGDGRRPLLFHANPDKVAELGRNGGRRRKHIYEQSAEAIAPPESVADVKRMLAETMADVKAGRMDPKVANTVAYVGTVLLRAYQADAAPTADTPARHTCRSSIGH